LTNRHRCFGKIRKIKEKCGLLLTHDEITFLCEGIWNCKDETEFYDRMNALTPEELKEEIEKMRKKMRKRKILSAYLESMAYT
jgi:hypothetical protein